MPASDAYLPLAATLAFLGLMALFGALALFVVAMNGRK